MPEERGLRQRRVAAQLAQTNEVVSGGERRQWLVLVSRRACGALGVTGVGALLG